MNIEIERKFLVLNDAYKQESFKKTKIKQGFLNSNKKRVVRIRLTDDTAFLTIKGISDTSGISRFEWEKEIFIDEAKQLLSLCEKGMIEKTRFYIQKGNHVFEVDEFLGDNKGLIVAEIELSTKKEKFIKPTWLGKEVTGIKKYYNSKISKHPFKDWV